MVGVAAALVTGLGAVETTVLAVSNIVAVLTVVMALRWWSPSTVGRGAPPTGSPRDMMSFFAATAIGEFAGVAIGAVGYLLAGRDLSAAGLVVWFGRNVCGMAAVGVTSLLILDRLEARRAGRSERRTTMATGGWLELALLFAATGALIIVDRLTVLPVSFLLPAAAVWPEAGSPRCPFRSTPCSAAPASSG